MTPDRNNIDLLVYLCSCAVKGAAPDKDRLYQADLDELFFLARRHKLAATAAVSVAKTGIVDDVFSKALINAIRKRALFDTERTAILNAFEEKGVWYMPLKGVVIQDLYPIYGMREMADNDILFDSSKVRVVREIMEARGFDVEQFGTGAHDVYYKKPVLNFEMHRMLFSKSNGEILNKYYDDVFALLVKDENNGFGYHLNNEDFYVYFVSHAYKHFHNYGTGLRTLLDIYVFLKHFQDLDWDYIGTETKKLEISEFENTIRGLSLKLFDDEQLNEKEQEMYDLIAAAGVYGNVDTKVINALGKEKRSVKDKLSYVVKRLGVPISENNPNYETFKGTYPVFYEHKILLLFLPIYRLYRAATIRRSRVLAELYAVIKQGDSDPKK